MKDIEPFISKKHTNRLTVELGVFLLMLLVTITFLFTILHSV